MRLTRPAAALLATAALLLSAACTGPDVTGDSNTGNQQSNPPQPQSSPS
jgi:hypothetical protein